MIYMLWDECVPINFYRYICGSENFTYLNGKNILHLQTSEMVWQFLYLEKNKSLIQYVYRKALPCVYTTTENRGVNFKYEFQLKFKDWNNKNQKENSAVGKDSAYYKKIEINESELKSIKIEERKLNRKRYAEKK